MRVIKPVGVIVFVAVLGACTSPTGANDRMLADASVCVPGKSFKATGHLNQVTEPDYDTTFHGHLTDAECGDPHQSSLGDLDVCKIGGGYVRLALADECAAGGVVSTILEPIKKRDESVMAVATRRDEVFLLLQKAGQTANLIVVRKGEALDTAVVLVQARPGRQLESVHPAKDAVYVLVREGGGRKVLRIPVRMSGGTEIGFTQQYIYHCRNCRSFPVLRKIRVLEVPLPYDGNVSGVRASSMSRGFSITLKRAGVNAMLLFYDPSSGRFREVK